MDKRPIEYKFLAGNIFITVLVGIICFLILDRFFPNYEPPLRERPPAERPPATVSKPAELNHEDVLQFILDHEGPISREIGHGGVGNRGITQESWHQWRSKQGDRSYLPSEVRNATLQESKRFYYDYFEKYHVWEMHPALQLIYADFATLAGHQAVRKVQQLVGTHQDSIWGVRTTRAVALFNATLTTQQQQLAAFENFDSMKRAFLNGLGKHPNYKADLPGWLKRSDDVKARTFQYLQ